MTAAATGSGVDLYTGWLLLAFLDELEHEVTPVTVGTRPLVVARDGTGVRVAEATCPHRGAHLGFGGVLTDDGIRCPFHGRVIGLGEFSDARLSVPTYRTIVVDEVVFVLIDERQERGFEALIDALHGTHRFVSGFVIPGRVTPELVIENAFDNDHFQAVHNVTRTPELRVRTDGDVIVAEGELNVRRPNLWQDEATATSFVARAVSPMLVATEIGNPGDSHVVFTSATPTPGGCVIRVAAAAPRDAADHVVNALLRDSQTAFEQDLVVWEHLVPGAPEHLDDCDRGVQEFRRFCEGFSRDYDGNP
jgi:3-ketosteroid 9alpha-monooxygenase subunit A